MNKILTRDLIDSAARDYLMTNFADSSYWYTGYIIWTGHAVLLIMVAACTTRYISPQAAGSGVAEMKVIIRGVVIKEYLSARTLLAKLIGVPFMLAAGLGLGKEVCNDVLVLPSSLSLFRILFMTGALCSHFKHDHQSIIQDIWKSYYPTQ